MPSHTSGAAKLEPIGIPHRRSDRAGLIWRLCGGAGDFEHRTSLERTTP